MIQQIRKIGNSSGVIIPKSMLDSCDISDSVQMEVIRDMIIIKPMRKKARENWDLMFEEANAKFDKKDDDLFDGISNEFDTNEW